MTISEKSVIIKHKEVSGDLMIYFLIVCLIIIGFLWYKLSQKQEIDRTALDNYRNEISETTKELKKLYDEAADLRH